jgi:hypothetical protein
MENKAETYRKMLAYLEALGADLEPHSSARLASASEATMADLDNRDLLHYQRVLEATIDHHDGELMDKEAMRDELTEVVRERFQRGTVEDKVAEAKEFRARLASL